MTKLKQILKKTAIYSCVFMVVASILAGATIKLGYALDRIVPTYQVAVINTAKAEREFNYLDKVPSDVIIAEIKKQSKEFGVSEKLMLDLARCESTFTNWKKNPKSTAKGVYQFIASTWDTTASGKNRISPYDFRANIREAMIKISDGQLSHWSECL